MHRLIGMLARVMAWVGGTVLIALVVMTCVSILGRLLNGIGHHEFTETYLGSLSGLLKNLGPINGDFELVEAGIAFAVMAFLPLCQFNKAHATVEIFTAFLPTVFNRFLALLWEALFAFLMIIIAWRLWIGTTDKMRYNETTFMLQFPVWWGYAACCVAAVIAAVVAVYAVWLRVEDVRSQPSKAQQGRNA